MKFPTTCLCLFDYAFIYVLLQRIFVHMTGTHQQCQCGTFERRVARENHIRDEDVPACYRQAETSEELSFQHMIEHVVKLQFRILNPLVVTLCLNNI